MICTPKFQVHVTLLQPEPPERLRKKERKGAGSAGGILLAQAPMGLALWTGFPSFPFPRPPAPWNSSPVEGREQCGRPDPRPPREARHSPPRSVPRCRQRRLPRRRPIWPWRVPPAHRPRSRSRRSRLPGVRWARCSAPTTPLTALLAAPAPAPHRGNPERTSGQARGEGRAACCPQTRGAAVASPGPSAPVRRRKRKPEAGGGGGVAAALPSCLPAGAAASRTEALREVQAARVRPRSQGRPDVAGMRRRLVLALLEDRLLGSPESSTRSLLLPQRPPSSATLQPWLPHIHTPRGTINRAAAATVASLLSGITPHTHTRTPGREGGREGAATVPAVSQLPASNQSLVSTAS